MSAMIAIAFAGMLLQQTATHPSTQTAYQAPVIRPFEPRPGFAGGPAQGDADAESHRRQLETPVTVEAYVRSYEFTPGNVETAYEQGVTSAEIRADQGAGPLDGVWRIVDADGGARYDLVLSDPGVGLIEGGWRDGSGWGAAASDGRTLTLDGAGSLTLERSGGGWRGALTIDERTQPVTLIRPH